MRAAAFVLHWKPPRLQMMDSYHVIPHDSFPKVAFPSVSHGGTVGVPGEPWEPDQADPVHAGNEESTPGCHHRRCTVFIKVCMMHRRARLDLHSAVFALPEGLLSRSGAAGDQHKT